MDWETKILEICEDLGVDPQLFNEHETTQEVVAKRLGFASYTSFVAFPDPIAIIDGRGLPLLDDHMSYQGALGESCISEMVSQWNLSQNVDDLHRQIVRIYKYMEENFQYEYTVVCSQLVLGAFDHLSLVDDEFDDMDDIISKYRNVVSGI